MGTYHQKMRLQGVWLKQKNSYIYIDYVASDTQMMGITRFDFDAHARLLRIATAKKGELTHGQWRLFNIQETDFFDKKIVSKKINFKLLGFKFEPKLLKQAHEDADEESIYTLFHNIIYRQETGLVASQYQYVFWKRVMQPLTTILMICLGIPFIFGSLRSSSMGLRIMTGVIIGFGFYMLNQFFGPITLVYQFPPILAAVFPTILFMVAYVILLKWTK